VNDHHRNLPTPRMPDIIEAITPERQRPYAPPYERRDLSLLFFLLLILALFIIVVLSCLFLIYAVTHLAKLPELAEGAVTAVQNGLVWLGGMIVIGTWLLFIKFVIGIGRDAGEACKVWVQAFNEIPKRHLWGMNTTHVVTDGKVPSRIESVRERSEHFHYGGEGLRRDEEREDYEEAEPLPRSSQILEQMRRRRYDSHAS
jgi:hypothetical protein